jgi:hypothetical protein
LVFLSLAGKLFEIGAAGRKLGFFGDQDRKAVFDLVNHCAALANEPITLQRQSLSRVQWATEYLKKVGTDHNRPQ